MRLFKNELNTLDISRRHRKQQRNRVAILRFLLILGSVSSYSHRNLEGMTNRCWWSDDWTQSPTDGSLRLLGSDNKPNSMQQVIHAPLGQDRSNGPEYRSAERAARSRRSFCDKARKLCDDPLKVRSKGLLTGDEKTWSPVLAD